MKYRILRFLDVTGFTFLSPVVRLLTGEEPARQLKEIGQFIVVPFIAFAVFLVVWSNWAPLHKTKSGEVPTPRVTADAAASIWRFHQREGEKEAAYRRAGPQRDQQLRLAQQRLATLEEEANRADAAVQQAEAAKVEFLQKKLAPLEVQSETLRAEFETAKEQRQAELYALAKEVARQQGDHQQLLDLTHQHLLEVEAEREQLTQLRALQSEVRSARFAPLVEAQNRQTRIAEERQFLVKLVEQLSRNNREAKIAAAAVQLDALKREYANASGEKAVLLATRIAKAQDRIDQIDKSEYAKPWTLPNQTIRSIACVFFGFLLGAAIAIPLGVLCGLSRTFMAAVTPFIALFKPVSPIVWLPISLIIVGGFIQDPDKHWFMQMLWNLPLIGWMKINPAFIASGVTVALCSLWPTLVNTALGVASIEKDHLNVARVLRLGFWSRLTKVIIPSALPLIFAGLRISLGVGWMVLIAAELLASSEGIGKFVWDQFNNGASDSFAKMFVVVFVVGSIGFLLDRIMIVLQRLVSFDGAPAAL